MSDEVFSEVMVTAHRRLPRGCVEEWLGAELNRIMQVLRDDFGMRRATTGMATGGDQTWGDTAMGLQVPLRAAIPYPDQPLDGVDDRPGQRWTKRQQAFWHTLREYAEDIGGVKYVSERNPTTFKQRVDMLHARNDWMLEHSEAVVGIWAPANRRSGTGSCLRKAASAGKPIILVNLATKAVTRPLPKHWAEYLHIPALARRAA